MRLKQSDDTSTLIMASDTPSHTVCAVPVRLQYIAQAKNLSDPASQDDNT